MPALADPHRLVRVLGACAGAAAGVYAATVAIAWWRYGHVGHPAATDRDDRLDRFMPAFDVVERHSIAVRAPAAVTLGAACDQDLLGLPLVRAIVRARELAMGASGRRALPTGLLASMRALGWAVLDEVPGREIVVGAVTRPWEADVRFRAVPPEEFARFAEPGYARIVWTLRADPETAGTSRFRTETRAVATDIGARRRFRRYWALVSPGIRLIRLASVSALKQEAERRARLQDSATGAISW